MNKKGIYFLIGILLIVDAYALYKARTANNRLREVQQESFLDAYASESLKNVEKIILGGSEIISDIDNLGINKSKPQTKAATKDIAGIDIYFIYQGDDCTNCIVQTWEMLNELRENIPTKVNEVKSYFYHNGGAKLEPLLEFNSLKIPTVKTNLTTVLKEYEITETPQVILTKSSTNKVLDAYQPEPNNFVRRSAFRTKWENILATM